MNVARLVATDRKGNSRVIEDSCMAVCFGILEEVNFACYTPGNRRNIELLYQRAMMVISASPPRWVHHRCNVPGCNEGMVVIDGNEKLTRAMCAAPKSKVTCPVNHKSCPMLFIITYHRWQTPAII